MTQAQWVRRVLKPVTWIACLAPFGLILFDGFTGGLSANPIEDITHRTGTTALIVLLVTLGVTPMTRWTRIGALIGMRRLLGLFAYFYAVLHFLTYLVLDQFFGWSFIVEDIVERPYITVGFAALVLLTPLAFTSTKGWIKRLGGKRWNALHKTVYVSTAFGVLHYLWLVKADTSKPIFFAAILVGLLVVRLQRKPRSKRAKRNAGATPGLGAAVSAD